MGKKERKTKYICKYSSFKSCRTPVLCIFLLVFIVNFSILPNTENVILINKRIISRNETNSTNVKTDNTLAIITKVDAERDNSRYLCPAREMGRINNIIIETMHGMYLAYLSKRTYLINNSLIEFYDFDYYNFIKVLAENEIQVDFELIKLNQFDQRIVTEKQYEIECIQGVEFTSAHLRKWKKMLEESISGSHDFLQMYADEKYISVAMQNLFFFEILGSKAKGYREAFFSSLKPKNHILNAVTEYTLEQFGETDTPYIAVHLRNLEGRCEARTRSVWKQYCPPVQFLENYAPTVFDKDLQFHTRSIERGAKFLNNKTRFYHVYGKFREGEFDDSDVINFTVNPFKFDVTSVCSPPYLALLEIVYNLFKDEPYNRIKPLLDQSNLGEPQINIYVLSDRQQLKVDRTYFDSDRVEYLYFNETLRIKIKTFGYFKECGDYCPIIDFEMAVQSTMLLGNYGSSASRNILNFKKYRDHTDASTDTINHIPSVLCYKNGLTISNFTDELVWFEF